jgi:hypothetical protein
MNVDINEARYDEVLVQIEIVPFSGARPGTGDHVDDPIAVKDQRALGLNAIRKNKVRA